MKEKGVYSNVGVLLLAFGGPNSLDCVEPFLKSVLEGKRPVLPEQVERAKYKYELIGGKSPLLDITKHQAKSLEAELSKAYEGMRVFVGMRHAHPFIKDTLKEMLESGIDKIIAISMAPHSSKVSTGGYINAVNDALCDLSDRYCEEPLGQAQGDVATCLPAGTVSVNFIENWHTHSLFLQAIAGKISESLEEFSSAEHNDVFIIFSAHSIPEKAAQTDPYSSQIQETIDGVINLIGPRDHCLAYQSKGGGPFPWLGPDVDVVLVELSQKGINNVLLVPVGFVSDHIETFYDIDIVYTEKAKKLGLNFKRTKSLNDDPKFIKMLACLVEQTFC